MSPTPPSPYRPPELSPTNAAEQFQRVNKSLPDGVRYEPLDDETMKILMQKNPAMATTLETTQKSNPATTLENTPKSSPATTPEATPKSNPTTTPAPTTPKREPAPQSFAKPKPLPEPEPTQEASPLPSPTPTLPDEALDILQELAQNERNAYVFYSHFSDAREAFGVLAENAEQRSEQYAQLLSQCFDKTFTAEETEINTEISINEAISLAVSEESRGLLALANLSELVAGTEQETRILRIINKKMIGQQLLFQIITSSAALSLL